MFFTRAGLEQASRPEVADHHASRFVQAGVRRVIDIGCGIGSDSMAFVRAGLEVLAVDIDPVTAVVAQANLADARECHLRRCKPDDRAADGSRSRGFLRPLPS